MSRRMRRTTLPSDADLYCMALADPGTFCARDENETLVSGTSLTLTGAREKIDCPDGTGVESGSFSLRGWICLPDPSLLSFTLSGTGSKNFPYYGGTPPDDYGGNTPSSAEYEGGAETGSQEAQGTATDCCETSSDFGSPFITGDVSKGPCCPVPFSIGIHPGGPCTGTSSHGYAGSNLSVLLEVIAAP